MKQNMSFYSDDHNVQAFLMDGFDSSFESVLEDELRKLDERLKKRPSNELTGGDREPYGQKNFGYNNRGLPSRR